ncbi:hypothetical protein PSH76_10015 [Pseudomonas sp. FP215]|nr:hypothetical protein [Pseudomonas sp. FP215]WLH26137.1 hypothetical protein PSH76_10015 [Pseudomonas sp. FP215]
MFGRVRSLSKQALIVDRLAQLVAEVNLYTALGGAWSEWPSLAAAR